LLQKPGFTEHTLDVALHTCQSSHSTSDSHLPSIGTHRLDVMLHICHASQSNWFRQPPGLGTHTCLVGLQISVLASQMESLSQYPARGLQVLLPVASHTCQLPQSPSFLHLFSRKAHWWVAAGQVLSVSLHSLSTLQYPSRSAHAFFAVSQNCHALQFLSAVQPCDRQPERKTSAKMPKIAKRGTVNVLPDK
jgi:hypothetical protein